MAIGQGSKPSESLANVAKKIGANPVQFFLAIFLVMCCAATKKFQTFPMVWIAGQSKCVKEVTKLKGDNSTNYADSFLLGENNYKAASWIETKPDCEEKAKVFTFVTEEFTITTANLVFFGFVKAIFNFVTGACCDRFGRKWTLIAGWILGIPMPFMVIFATGWWTVALSNIFLGMQQALVWSATIFIMVDYLGQDNSGAAIGMNETIGYTTVAIVTVIAAALMDENEPRTTCYYVVMGLIFANILVAVVCLKESKVVAVQEEAERTGRSLDQVETTKSTQLQWPSGRSSDIHVQRSAFIYTSFVNNSLMTVCFAGLMINFISGFAWGLFKKWMKSDYEVDGELKWEKFSKEEVASVVLCYGLLKGLLQFIFGFLGDRIGRKWLISGGLYIVCIGLVVVAVTGSMSDAPFGGFAAGALLMGLGTGVMYTNNLAAICDHSDPSWRSSALGSYRFWRDSGYAIGALVTGAMADAVGIPWSVGLTAIITFTSATLVALFYQEVPAGGCDKPSAGQVGPQPNPTKVEVAVEAYPQTKTTKIEASVEATL